MFMIRLNFLFCFLEKRKSRRAKQTNNFPLSARREIIRDTPTKVRIDDGSLDATQRAAYERFPDSNSRMCDSTYNANYFVTRSGTSKHHQCRAVVIARSINMTYNVISVAQRQKSQPGREKSHFKVRRFVTWYLRSVCDSTDFKELLQEHSCANLGSLLATFCLQLSNGFICQVTFGAWKLNRKFYQWVASSDSDVARKHSVHWL